MTISFKDQELERTLSDRSSGDISAGQVAKRDLDRYYWLIQQSQLVLSTSEFGLICDALHEIWFSEPWTMQGLSATIQDAIALDNLDKRWEIANPHGVLTRLSAASPVQIACLIDRV